MSHLLPIQPVSDPQSFSAYRTQEGHHPVPNDSADAPSSEQKLFLFVLSIKAH